MVWLGYNTGMGIRFGKPKHKQIPYLYGFFTLKTIRVWLPYTKIHALVMKSIRVKDFLSHKSINSGLVGSAI